MGLENVELELVDTVNKAGQLMSWLGERRDVLAFDTETSGLDPESCALRLVQFGDEVRGWSIPWERWGGVAVEVLNRYEGELTGHNSGFDVRFLELHGGLRMPRERIHDTMFMCHLLNPAAPKGLKPNAARLVDGKAAYASKVLDEAMAKQKWTWATVPVDFQPYWAYGALDTVLTAHLHHTLRPKVESSYHDVYELERNCGWVLRDMERRGARIDLNYTALKRQELERFAKSVEDWCQTAHDVAPGSNNKVAERLLALGASLTAKTATGAWQLDESVILSLLGVTELEDADTATFNPAQHLAHQVLLRRKAEKIRTTYLDTFLDLADSSAIVHCHINQLGARTGRMSIEAPALQTLPRGPVVRDCFVPRDGNTLLTADFDAVEMRLLAHFAGDPSLNVAIGDGQADIHTAMARLMYNDPTLSKREERRQVMKNVNFAKLYGAGLEKIALTARVTVPQAKAFLDMYDSTFPGVRAFQHTVSRVAEQRQKDEGIAYVKTPIGRYQPADDSRDYSLVNYLVQGTAADVFKEALVRLDEAGAGEWMVLPVHDEVIFDVPTPDVKEAKQLITTAMTDTRWNVPLNVSVDGPLDRWGTKYRQQ